MKFSSSSTALLLTVLSVVPLSAQSLRGSQTSVARMYNHAQAADLHFFTSGRGIRNAAEEGSLVKLVPDQNYTMVGVSYPFVRPITRTFLERLSSQYRSACGERLVVTSAARPRSLHLINSVTKTVHPTGMAVDLRRSNRASCRNWLRSTLLSLEGGGVLEATEEHNPPHFHVAVFPGPYSEYLREKAVRVPAVTRTAATTKIDAPVRRTAVATPVRRHKVRSGESLWGIARKAGTSVARLKAVNSLSSSTIRAGQTLVLP